MTRTGRLAVLCCAFLTLPPAAALADINVGAGVRVNAPVKSIKRIRDSFVVLQRYDYSCGASALATLLRYGFGDRVAEQDILKQLFDLLTEEEEAVSRREGFSLLDLQRVALARGFNAEGFRLEPADLDKISGPVIVFIEPRGYRHFAVLRGVRGGRVYLADPSRGNVRMPVYAFLKMWRQADGRGVVFAVEPKGGPPRGPSPLALPGRKPSQPEIMTAREKLAVGDPLMFHDIVRRGP